MNSPHRYRVTDTGLHIAMVLTRLRDRVLPAALAPVIITAHTQPGELRKAAWDYQAAIDQLICDAGLAA